MQPLTALENVSMPLMFKGVHKKKRNKEAKDLLTAVGLGSHIKHKPNQMSGGQQQRVGIARSFVGTPDVIFADEPTGNLDSKTSEEVLTIMEAMVRDKHQALVIVTHDTNVSKIADKIIHVLDGRIEKIEYVNKEAKEVPKEEIKEVIKEGLEDTNKIQVKAKNQLKPINDKEKRG
jgi:putative ABC transport system ATP-binding protein